MFVHHLVTTAGYRKAQEENNNFVSRENLESRALYRVWDTFWTMTNKQDVEREQISGGIRYHMLAALDFSRLSGSWLICLKGKGEEGAGAQELTHFSLHTEKDIYWWERKRVCGQGNKNCSVIQGLHRIHYFAVL